MTASWPKISQRLSRGDWCIDLGTVPVLVGQSVINRRRRVFAATKEEAEAMAAQHRQRRDAAGLAGAAMTAAQVQDALAALQALQGRATLLQAATAFVATCKHSAEDPKTVAEAFALYEAHLAKEKASGQIGERHYQTLRGTLSPFVAVCGQEGIAAFNRKTAEYWLDSREHGCPQTKRNCIQALSAFFSFAVDQGWLAANPIDSVKRPRVKYRRPEHLSADAVEAVLRIAQEKYLSAVPRLAAGFFAGLRAAELDKLDWKDVRLDAGVIIVSEEIAKKGIPRSVTISANLGQWLKPHWTEEGPFCDMHPKAFYRAVQAICDECGVEWVDNAMRHTFATHHLALHQDAGKTAKELGHLNGVRILYQHYANAGLTKAEAEAYWRVAPFEVARQEEKTA